MTHEQRLHYSVAGRKAATAVVIEDLNSFFSCVPGLPGLFDSGKQWFDTTPGRTLELQQSSLNVALQ